MAVTKSRSSIRQGGADLPMARVGNKQAMLELSCPLPRCGVHTALRPPSPPSPPILFLENRTVASIGGGILNPYLQETTGDYACTR